VWRVYSLLSGVVQQDESDGLQTDYLYAALDWKRVFGLCLWYGTSVDASIADVVNAHERILLQNSKGTFNDVARPIPRWAEKAIAHQPLAVSGLGLFMGASKVKDSIPQDPLYVLIRLHADPALSLTSALNPLSFSPSGLDWGIAMCWHLYIILSRVMSVRDFADRSDSTIRSKPSTKGRKRQVNGIGGGSRTKEVEDDHDGIRVEGYSPSADLLATGYALELESWGMIQEAAFVLLHLEQSSGFVFLRYHSLFYLCHLIDAHNQA
jgi:nuclear pore complex protein Nup98-Nup96